MRNLERSDIVSLGSDVGSLVQETLPGNRVVGEPHKPDQILTFIVTIGYLFLLNSPISKAILSQLFPHVPNKDTRVGEEGARVTDGDGKLV